MLVVPDAAALAAGCGFCGAQSCALEVKCGGCETYYCSRYCKVQHWGGGGHSQVCVEAVSPTAETVRKASLEFSPRSEEDRRLLAAKKPHAHAHAHAHGNFSKQDPDLVFTRSSRGTTLNLATF